MKKILLIVMLICLASSAYAKCRVGYFVVPRAFIHHMKMIIDNGDTLISSGELDPEKVYEVVKITGYLGKKYKVGSIFTGESFDISDKGVVKEITVISDGNLDPAKHYEIIKITGYIGDFVVGDRFTGLSANITGKGVVKEVSSIYPLRHIQFEAFVVGTTNTGKKIIKAIMKPHWIKEVRRFIRDDDITSAAALAKIKIQNAYIGPDSSDVFTRFPETIGQIQIGVDEFGAPIMVDKLSRGTWICE